jgi:hypothetical protein
MKPVLRIMTNALSWVTDNSVQYWLLQNMSNLKVQFEAEMILYWRSLLWQ